MSSKKEVVVSRELLCCNFIIYFVAVVVLSPSHVWLFETPWIAAHLSSLSSPSPRAYSNSCPMSQWCHPTISSSVIPFSCLQSFPASGSFLMNQIFASGGQSIGASALASVLLIYLVLTGLISLQSKVDSQESSPAPQFESINSLVLSLLYGPTLASIRDC